MSDLLFLVEKDGAPTAPKTVSSVDNVTHVAVSVIHNRHRKRVDVCVYPAQMGADGSYTLAITNGKYCTLEPMQRLNRARLAYLVDVAKSQVQDRSGPVFDLVQAVCAEQGVKLV